MVVHLAATLLSASPHLFLQTNAPGGGGTPNITNDIKNVIITPVMNVLSMLIPVAVALYIIYKVLAGNVEHAKMLIAEGVIVAGVLEGVLLLAKQWAAQTG